MVKEFLTIDELSQYLNLKRSTLYSMVESAELPHYEIGRLIRFKRVDIDRWMEGHRRENITTDKQAREILKPTTRSRIDVDNLVKKTVAEIRRLKYIPTHRETRPIKDLGKEVSDGVYKRGLVWWMRFTYRGKQIRVSTESGDKELAQRIYFKVLGEVAEGKWFERLRGEDKTFREMMEKFESEYFSNLASYRACRTYVKGLKSFFGDYTLSEITPSLINEFKNRRKTKGVKPATVHRQLDIMKRAFNIAIREWEWCKANPVTRVSLERLNNKRDRWLTLDEEKKLLQACPGWLNEIATFGLNTGMRQGEILSLTWKGVDLFRKTVTVFKSKNNERRTIPLNSTVTEMLKGKSKVRSIKTDLVFHSKAHTPFSQRNIERAFQNALKKAKIEDFGFHDLRHTFATRLVQAGVDLYKVQILLGHKTPAMTQRYAHHYPESLRDGVAVLDKISTNSAHLDEEEAGCTQLSR
jgi:excisionase family DNA binding protein